MTPNSVDSRASARFLCNKTKNLTRIFTYRILPFVLLLSAAIPRFLNAAEVVLPDAAGVTIEYTPEFIAPWIDSKGNLQLSLRNGVVVQVPGESEQPARNLIVAVPPGSSPTYRIIAWEAGETIQGSFAVHPTGGVSVDFPQARMLNNARNGTLEIRSLLGLATVSVPIFPTRFQENGREVVTAKKIIVRIDFHPPQRTTAHQPVTINRLHRLVVANTEQAASWGRYKTSSLTMQRWPTGYLYKFEVEEEGIYQLTFEDLTGSGVQIAGSGVPSGQIKLFGNGGTELPLAPEAEAAVGLKECAIIVEDGGDGLFGPGDKIVFYGRSAGGFGVNPTTGTYYSLNHYSNRNIYWFNIDPAGGGKRMSGIPDDVLATDTLTTANCLTHLEPDRFIYGSSAFVGAGRDWYGFTFDGMARASYSIGLPLVDPSAAGRLGLRIVRSTGGQDPWIKVSVNHIPVDTLNAPGDYPGSNNRIEIPAGVLRAGINTVMLEQIRSNTAEALFDWLEISYTATLNGTVVFTHSSTQPRPVSYKNAARDAYLFDVTISENVRFEHGATASIGIEPSNRRFISIRPTDFRRITTRFQSYFPPSEDIPDLYSLGNRADILLIVPDNFYDAVESLYNHYPRRNPPLTAARVRLSEIYNRFSGGVADPAAIRNLLHYAKDNWATPPQFVLLCGDGDYNYRDIDRPANPDFLPPYEGGSDKSFICADDWFVDFTAGGRDLVPEMAIGRLTAQRPSELKAICDKIVRYDEEPEFGLWRNRVTLAADDETSETSNYEYEHVEFSEQLARSILPGSIDKVKVYETEYARLSGREKPMATEALLSSINDGTTIVNYMGHGNPTVWAHEKLFYLTRDLNRVRPGNKLPLFIAFTCDWAYWDDPGAQSFPEQMLVDPDGGAIAAIASTRLTYSPPNQTLSQYFYSHLYRAEDLTIGEALWAAKQADQGWTSTSPTYHLLGDPSLRLATPRRRGEFTSFSPFPLQPLAKTSMAGEVHNDAGSLDPLFAGQVLFTLRDSAIPRQYIIGEDENSITLNYTLPGALAYRGFFSLADGRFDGDFVVPRDVTLNGIDGRAVAYFYNETTDGVAYVDTIRYAGRGWSGVDTIPPVINLYFDHRGYREGDDVSGQPLVILDAFDSSGINLTGAMGHGIWLTIGDTKPINLTKSFRFQLDSYQQGSLEQRLGQLDPGTYPVQVEAWDSYNNLAVKKSEINVVASSGGLVIDRILNWPNPFNETTALTFMINKPAEYEIKIFTVGGRLIRHLHGRTTRNGMVSDLIWDGRDSHGVRVGNGVYLYKVIACDDEGGKADGIGRIAFIR